MTCKTTVSVPGGSKPTASRATAWIFHIVAAVRRGCPVTQSVSPAHRARVFASFYFHSTVSFLKILSRDAEGEEDLGESLPSTIFSFQSPVTAYAGRVISLCTEIYSQ